MNRSDLWIVGLWVKLLILIFAFPKCSSMNKHCFCNKFTKVIIKEKYFLWIRSLPGKISVRNSVPNGAFWKTFCLAGVHIQEVKNCVPCMSEHFFILPSFLGTFGLV